MQHLCLCDPAANSEYYNLLMQNGQDERRDASVFSLEKLERVTSEHTLKNTVNMHAEKEGHINCTFTCGEYFYTSPEISRSPKI